MVARAGGSEVDPPRIARPCYADPTNVLYQIPLVVSLTMTAMFNPCTAIATGLLVVPPVLFQPLDRLPTGWRLVVDLIVLSHQQIDE